MDEGPPSPRLQGVCGTEEKAPPRISILVQIVNQQNRSLSTAAKIGGKEITLQSIFRNAGIAIRTEIATRTLSGVPEDGYRDKDVVEVIRNLERPSGLREGEYLVRALYMTQKAGPLGLKTLGELAQPPHRDTIIVYAAPHAEFGTDSSIEAFLTLAHEMTHAVGMHHAVWKGQSFFANSTIESWSPAQSVSWCLNPAVSRYLRTTNLAFVRPDRSGLSFDFASLGQLSLFNEYPPELLTEVPEDRAESILRSEQAEVDSQIRLRATAGEGVAGLSIDLEKTQYELLESVAANATVTNKTADPISVTADVTTGGSISWQVRNVDIDRIVCASSKRGDEYRGEAWAPLAGRRSVTTRVDVSADPYRWCFRQPGHYQIEMYEQVKGVGWLSATSKILEVSQPSSAASANLVKEVDEILGKDVWRRFGEMYRIGGGPELLHVEAELERLTIANAKTRQAATLAKILVGELSAPTMLWGNARRARPDAARAAPFERIILSSEGSASEKTKSYADLTDSLYFSENADNAVIEKSPLMLKSLLLAQFVYKSDIVGERYAGTFGFIGNLLKSQPSMRILLVGHSDFRGSRGANLAMGCRRAVASRNELLAAGARLNQIAIVSAGNGYPISDDADQNRRVEVGTVASGAEKFQNPYPNLELCSKPRA
jgi:flagellar motor protein MotB